MTTAMRTLTQFPQPPRDITRTMQRASTTFARNRVQKNRSPAEKNTERGAKSPRAACFHSAPAEELPELDAKNSDRAETTTRHAPGASVRDELVSTRLKIDSDRVRNASIYQKELSEEQKIDSLPEMRTSSAKNFAFPSRNMRSLPRNSAFPPEKFES
jgi:hypothetical protein